MPPKDMNEYKIGIITDNGIFHELKSIEPCTLDSGNDFGTVDRNISKGGSVSFDFDCNFDGMNSGDLYLVLSGVCTLTQINQNNWRRMHGLPMKSRRKRRK